MWDSANLIDDMETRRRSFMKALTWRVIALILATLLAYLFSKNLKGSVLFSLVLNGVNTVLFYFHERIWNRIDYGRHL